MSPAKTNELLATLRAACARQFGFNPRRVAAGMRYVGTEGHGKDLVYVFRDAGTHSQMVLKNTFVSLRETHGDKPHLSETEKAHYRDSDQVIDDEIEAKRVELEFIRASALYQDHRQELLSHYKDWPGHQAGSTNPREAARALIGALTAAGDARLSAFAEHVGSNDAEHLAHLLLAPCHLELEAARPAAAIAQ